jgi:hypothetical protein
MMAAPVGFFRRTLAACLLTGIVVSPLNLLPKQSMRHAAHRHERAGPGRSHLSRLWIIDHSPTACQESVQKRYNSESPFQQTWRRRRFAGTIRAAKYDDNRRIVSRRIAAAMSSFRHGITV